MRLTAMVWVAVHRRWLPDTTASINLLEQALAEFLQREKVLLCSSGYLANLAVTTSLAGKGDVIIQDKLCHASLIDAARLSWCAVITLWPR